MAKTVFITGASSGFGKDAAKLFHQRGWQVVASMRSPEKETELNKLDNVLLVKLDVTNTGTIQQAVKAATDQFGRIDVLVNNAGYGAMGALEVATEQEIRDQFEVNFFGLVNTIKAVLPVMREQQSGVIINLSSMGGQITFPFGSLYHATKFAVEGLTESIQYELNPLGIHLKIIEPGGYQTNFAGSSMKFIGSRKVAAYQPVEDRIMAFLNKPDRGNKNISEVSETIYQAATDGSDQLRYPIGPDAVQLIQYKQAHGDVAFKKMLSAQFGM